MRQRVEKTATARARGAFASILTACSSAYIRITGKCRALLQHLHAKQKANVPDDQQSYRTLDHDRRELIIANLQKNIHNTLRVTKSSGNHDDNVPSDPDLDTTQGIAQLREATERALTNAQKARLRETQRSWNEKITKNWRQTSAKAFFSLPAK